jgi:hypothetical protein
MDLPPLPRSRFFSVIGWICILLGIYPPVAQVIWYLRLRETLEQLGGLDYKALHIASFLDMLGLCSLSVAARWGLFKRHSWGPILACVAAGAYLVDFGCNFRDIARTCREASLALSPRDLKVLTAWLGIGFLGFRLMIWLILLGAIYREQGRREFDPPLTTRAFWTSSGAGAVLSGLIHLVLLGIWEYR